LPARHAIHTQVNSRLSRETALLRRGEQYLPGPDPRRRGLSGAMTVLQVVFQPFGNLNVLRDRFVIPLGLVGMLRVGLFSPKDSVAYILLGTHRGRRFDPPHQLTPNCLAWLRPSASPAGRGAAGRGATSLRLVMCESALATPPQGPNRFTRTLVCECEDSAPFVPAPRGHGAARRMSPRQGMLESALPPPPTA